MFNVEDDPAEHMNLKNAEPARYAALKAELDDAIGVVNWRSIELRTRRTEELGIYDFAQPSASSSACTAMETVWGGFFGPFAGIDPGPTPPPAPPPSRSDCEWREDVDYDVNGSGSLGPPR